MATVLKITVADGDKQHTHEVPIGPLSTITVKSGGDIHSFAGVEKVTIVEKRTDDPADDTIDTPVGLTSAADAVEYASSLADADAAAHLERAQARWPKNKAIEDALAEIDARIRTVAPEA